MEWMRRGREEGWIWEDTREESRIVVRSCLLLAYLTFFLRDRKGMNMTIRGMTVREKRRDGGRY